MQAVFVSAQTDYKCWEGGGGRVEGEREREAFDKRVDVSRSGSRKTFRESKTIRKELCRVAEIPG